MGLIERQVKGSILCISIQIRIRKRPSHTIERRKLLIGRDAHVDLSINNDLRLRQ